MHGMNRGSVQSTRDILLQVKSYLNSSQYSLKNPRFMFLATYLSNLKLNACNYIRLIKIRKIRDI